MFENILKFFKKSKKEDKKSSDSKSAAKERLHLVLMQDRANVSADFLDLMRQEIIDVIKKYIEVDESAIDVRLTNKENEDGTNGAPALYANIPILNIKNESRKITNTQNKDNKQEINDKEKNNEKNNEKLNEKEENDKKEDEKLNEENKENEKIEEVLEVAEEIKEKEQKENEKEEKSENDENDDKKEDEDEEIITQEN